jgi:hypothetical protein
MKRYIQGYNQYLKTIKESAELRLDATSNAASQDISFANVSALRFQENDPFTKDLPEDEKDYKELCRKMSTIDTKKKKEEIDPAKIEPEPESEQPKTPSLGSLPEN